MDTHTQDPWKEAADGAGGVEGARLKCNGKTGVWTADGVEIETGPDGLKLAIIMPTALHGTIVFRDGSFPDRDPIRYEDQAPDRTVQLPDGVDPLTECLCVGMDEEHIGQLFTFQSASHGGRHAFETLLKPFWRRGKLAFPVVTLDSREKGDAHDNYAPVFVHKNEFIGRDRFPHLLPPETAALPAPQQHDTALPAPATAAEPAAPLPRPKPIQIVTTGRAAADTPTGWASKTAPAASVADE